MGGRGSKSSVQPLPGTDDVDAPTPTTSPRKSMFGLDGLDATKVLTSRKTRLPQTQTEDMRQVVKSSENGVWDIEDNQGNRKPLPSTAVTWFKSRSLEALHGSLAFVPWIVQQASGRTLSAICRLLPLDLESSQASSVLQTGYPQTRKDRPLIITLSRAGLLAGRGGTVTTKGRAQASGVHLLTIVGKLSGG